MAAFGVLTPQEQADVPPNWLDRFVKYTMPFDWQGVTLNRSMDTPEYKPGMKFSDMFTPEAIQQGIDAGMAASGGGLATKVIKPSPVLGVLHGTDGGWTFRPQKAVSGYHGTADPSDFSKFRNSDKDIGVHIATNPNVSNEYSLGGYSTALNDVHAGSTAIPLPRTYPVVADLDKTFRLPLDFMYWKNPDSYMFDILKDIASATSFPKGMLSGLESAAKSSGSWERNLVPFMQEKGYDAIKYRHHELSNVNPAQYNSYMVFDSNKVAPKYSPEGQEIVAKRGGTIRPVNKKLWFSPDEFEWPSSMLKRE